MVEISCELVAGTLSALGLGRTLSGLSAGKVSSKSTHYIISKTKVKAPSPSLHPSFKVKTCVKAHFLKRKLTLFTERTHSSRMGGPKRKNK